MLAQLRTTYRWMPRVNRGYLDQRIAMGAIAPYLAIRLPDMGHRHPALSGLEEFDGDLFALNVGQLVRTEQNRKGFCLR